MQNPQPFIPSLLPTANFSCSVSLFHVFCGPWKFLKAMNTLFNVAWLYQLINVFPPVLQTGSFCYFAFLFAHIGQTGLFIILQICPTNMCFNTSVCNAVLALNSMFPLSFPIEILYFHQPPIQIPSLMIV